MSRGFTEFHRSAVHACAVAIAVALGGCAALPADPARPGADETPCDAFFAQVDAVVADAGVQDAEASRVPGFAHYRVDRFLASHRLEVDDGAMPAWADALRRLDRQARAVEIAQLSEAARRQLQDGAAALGLPMQPPEALVATCGQALRDRDLADPLRRARLREAARVPDDYVTGHRVLGLYWLTRLPFALGVRQYQAGVQATFALPADALPVAGHRVRYRPPPGGGDAARAAARLRDAGAHFQPLDPADVDRVLAAHAPVLDVDEALPEDRIGTVRHDVSGNPVVDTARPTVYGRIGFTRWQGRVLLQASYTAWFPARPKTGPLDLLGGAFDALVWRVTLDEAGTPLLFDTMHACGCYHQFFPTPRVRPRPRPPMLDEWALVPQTLPAVATGASLRLRIASRSHYLVRVETEAGDADPTARAYALRPEVELRALPAADGTLRSLYGPHGLVPGSERGERWLFWPMGIREPGAMRQWGRHATAFIGRRHFDDADLLARYFVLE